jgi:tetratricopeptide (TPR) repeat protein
VPDRRTDDRRSSDRGDRPPPPPGLQKRADEPRLPDVVDTRGLPRGVKAELRGLPKDLAEVVAGHLVTAGMLIDEDPELAYRHAEAARRRAARLPVVREPAAETAYAAGHWDVALSEFRALRRMTGTDDYLPVMADCERALGRPQAAIKIAKEARRKQLEPALAIEMLLVEAGARSDLGQQPEARRLLHQAILDLDDRRAAQLGVPAARLYYAYADILEQTGKPAEARQWFDAAARLDPDGDLDADERRDLLDGMTITFDDSDDEAGDDDSDDEDDDSHDEAGDGDSDVTDDDSDDESDDAGADEAGDDEAADSVGDDETGEESADGGGSEPRG